MKKILLVFLEMILLSALPVCAGDFPIVSPDHPPIWYNPVGMKVTQDLTWDNHHQQLVLHLAYDEVEFTPQSDQTYYDTFKLTFPTVQLDSSNNQLFIINGSGRRVNIGRVVDGLMGNRAVLEDGLQLSAHRNDGKIVAKIEQGNPADSP